jgi:hypothetical protein
VPSFTCKIEGLQELRDKLRANAPKARHAVKKTLYQFANEVMGESLQVVPVLTGALMGTGKVQEPVEDGPTISVTMGYGDEAVGYAIYVHEALEGPHEIDPNWNWAKAAAAGKPINYTRPGSGPKFLSNPLQAKQDKLPGLIKDAYRDALTS